MYLRTETSFIAEFREHPEAGESKLVSIAAGSEEEKRARTPLT
jgi:hypothetical protein